MKRGIKSIGDIKAHCIVDENGCWIWQKSCAGNGGYPIMHYQHKLTAVHRVVFALVNGPIPHGLCVCHTCDVKKCVNPEHLFVGRQQDNANDAKYKMRLRGGDGSKYKLTEDDVMAIRADQRSHRKLTLVYGVSYQNIGHVKSGKCWRHIPMSRQPG